MRLIVGKDEEARAHEALGIIAKVTEAFADGHQYRTSDEETQKMNDFLNGITVSIGTSGELDTVLMGEIGKSYRTQYQAAQESGDTAAEHRFYGAMFATKKIMDMLKEPEY